MAASNSLRRHVPRQTGQQGDDYRCRLFDGVSKELHDFPYLG